MDLPGRDAGATATMPSIQVAVLLTNPFTRRPFWFIAWVKLLESLETMTTRRPLKNHAFRWQRPGSVRNASH